MPLTEEDGLRAYCKMLNSLRVDAIEHLLADDFTYESQQVIHPLASRQQFLDYIRPKLEAIARVRANVYAEMGSISAYGRRQPCAVLAQDSKSNLVGIVLAKVSGDKLTRLDLCIVPPPHSADRTGEYPTLSNTDKPPRYQ
jgi:hypothetical protein